MCLKRHHFLNNGLKDHGYAWVIALLSCASHAAIYAILYTVGIWNTVFMEEFHDTAAYTSLIGSSCNALCYTTALPGSILLLRYSCRSIVFVGSLMVASGFILSSMATSVTQLLFTFSFLVGSGMGLAYIPSVVIIEQYFDKKRCIALGLCTSGAGFGMVLYPPLNNWLLANWQWRTALVANSSLALLLGICGLLMVPFKTDNPEKEKEITCDDDPSANNSLLVPPPILTESEEQSCCQKIGPYIKIFACFQYTMFVINNIFFYFAITIVWVHLNGHIKAKGIASESNAALIFCAVGLTHTLGKIFLGFLCHYPPFTARRVYTVYNFLLAMVFLLMPQINSYNIMVAAALLFGFLSACGGGSTFPEIIIENLGTQFLGVGYGVVTLFETVGTLLGPLISGVLFDVSQSYEYSLYLISASFFIGGLLMIVSYVLPYCSVKPEAKYETNASKAVVKEDP